MIAVFGSINVDIVVNVPNLPSNGETVVGNGCQLIPGGKGANQAVAACRAGANVKMFGAIGKDEFYDIARKNLDAEGCCTCNVLICEGTKNGLALIGVDSHGENQIIVTSGANQLADPHRLYHISDEFETLVLQLELPITSVIEAISIGRSEGGQVILNSAPFNKKIVPHLIDVDVLVANEVEAEAIAKELDLSTEPEKFVEQIVKKFDNKCVVTLGSKGCVGNDGTQSYKISAPDVAVIDSTGAGDTFVGFLAASLDQAEDFETALIKATLAGSLACTLEGAQEGTPDLEEVLLLYQCYNRN